MVKKTKIINTNTGEVKYVHHKTADNKQLMDRHNYVKVDEIKKHNTEDPADNDATEANSPDNDLTQKEENHGQKETEAPAMLPVSKLSQIIRDIDSLEDIENIVDQELEREDGGRKSIIEQLEKKRSQLENQNEK